MKLNKILMSTLVGCSLLTPVILSSCSIKNSSTSSNNEEQKPKTIPVPFQSSLYDTWDPTSSRLTFCSFSNPTYEIPNVEEWLKNESNNGRNFFHETKINGDTKNDSFSCGIILDGNLHPPLFKTVNDFYTWIKKSENNYDLSLLAPNENIEDKIFNFRTINWDFITNPNCYVGIYIYTHYREMSDVSTNRYIRGIRIQTFPVNGYEWQINRYDNNGDYNNKRAFWFEFYFNDQTTPTNQ